MQFYNITLCLVMGEMAIKLARSEVKERLLVCLQIFGDISQKGQLDYLYQRRQGYVRAVTIVQFQGCDNNKYIHSIKVYQWDLIAGKTFPWSSWYLVWIFMVQWCHVTLRHSCLKTNSDTSAEARVARSSDGKPYPLECCSWKVTFIFLIISS